MQVLIVEDEEYLAEALAQMLQEENHTSDIVYNGREGLERAKNGLYDVILLDVMLPELDGFSVVQQLRAEGINTPVLILTAKDDVADTVTGLDCGADDYMTKPFNQDELLARVRALGRRQGEVQMDTLTYEDLILELEQHQLRCGKKSVRLGYKEFEVFRMLLANPRAVVSKTRFINKIWGLDTTVEDNNVEAYVSFLRKKLKYLESKVGIVTLRKSGYYLDVINQ